MKIENGSPSPSSEQRKPVGLIICYLLLGLPASLTIGSLIAQVLTINVSNFEGGSGYAWVWILMIISPLTYLACLIALPILIKKYVNALSTVVIVFGILSIFSLSFLASL
ncbi:hypothetical protein R4532_13455 [Acinetobacter baumannii]|uniref:hypothetical protein n=1 Tax=Acinetobacter baumannii TaxID=470 RepID=UPI00295667D6|nr:hypothetical protein [Acinetobacter baumannii]